MAHNYRTGIGYDSHRLVKGRPLFLGGIRIPHSHGLLGHSDADVILHAAVDALLGAAGLADIGAHFSNQEARWKNVSSLFFLKKTAQMISKKKMKIVNLDCVLLSEAPKIALYIPRMKEGMAQALNISQSAVGVKASTNEGMGFVGKREGMAAWAVALVRKP